MTGKLCLWKASDAYDLNFIPQEHWKTSDQCLFIETPTHHVDLDLFQDTPRPRDQTTLYNKHTPGHYRHARESCNYNSSSDANNTWQYDRNEKACYYPQ
jgi:hypothetical protein